jgi:hypothetical protein
MRCICPWQTNQSIWWFHRLLDGPFFGLRDYGTGHPAEVGSEATPAEFLQALWAATAEIKRVLKLTGSAFVNLGDKYNAHAAGNTAPNLHRNGERAVRRSIGERKRPGMELPEKSLLLLPEAYRLGCTGMLAALGGPDPGLNLIARAVIIQSKINGLPESVDDRVRRSHEDWVHLVKSPRYYSAIDELREPQSQAWRSTGRVENRGTKSVDGAANNGFGLSGKTPREYNPLGKMPGSVWPIASEPLDLPDYLVRGLPGGPTMMDAGPLWRHVAWMRATGQPGPVDVRELSHYASFASEIPRRLVLGFSPPGICVDCGHGRFPVVDRRFELQPDVSVERVGYRGKHAPENGWKGAPRGSTGSTILGYACACTPHTDHPGTGEPSGEPQMGSSPLRADGHGYIRPGPESTAGRAPGMGGPTSLAYKSRVGPWREYHLNRWTPPPTRPAVILDPFGGVGTTAAVAVALGRVAVTVDLGHDYGLAARWRVRHAPILAKTAQRTNNDAQTRAVDPGPPVPVPPKPPTLTYRDPEVEQVNRERQTILDLVP